MNKKDIQELSKLYTEQKQNELDPSSWSIDRLSAEIKKAKDEIERLESEAPSDCELTNRSTERLIELLRRQIQRYMKFRADKF